MVQFPMTLSDLNSDFKVTIFSGTNNSLDNGTMYTLEIWYVERH